MKNTSTESYSKVLVLGGTGMLGNTITQYLSETLKNYKLISTFKTHTPSYQRENVRYVYFDVNRASVQDMRILFDGIDVVINCLGLIWQKSTKETKDLDFLNINHRFPIQIQELQEEFSFKFVHIGTDCVFNGKSEMPYVEEDKPNTLDIYGYSKARAEQELKNAMILRSSIIGRSLSGNHSLLDWFLSQSASGKTNGYTNHFWNGVGSLQLAKIVSGFLHNQDKMFTGLQHIVPSDTASKYELLEIFAKEYHRPDIQVQPCAHETMVNRVLATSNPTRNLEIWSQAGYPEIPSIRDMVREMSKYSFLGNRK